MTRFLSLLVFVGLSQISIAQVSNNDIQNRLDLNLNSPPISSSTAQSTVEWKCVNKALTNKCLIYHNDQWFNFFVSTGGTYFINISGQKCRDLHGIQIIVIEGNPCETKTYRLLQCIPQIRQDDVFIQLDSLKPNMQYLINIDGFLGDFCEFRIQVSERPNGLPRTFVARDTIKAEITRSGELVNLSWTVAEDKIDQFQSFKIYRELRKTIKSDFINEQSVSRNSYGAYVLNYSAMDSMHKAGTYIYQIFGIRKQTQFPYLLVTRSIVYTEPTTKLPPPQRNVTLQFDFKDKTSVDVIIYNPITHTVLRKFTTEFKKSNPSLEVDVGEFVDRGLRQFMFLVSDPDAREALEFYYAVDEQGRIVKQ